MEGIILSNQAKITDPILSDFVRKSTELIKLSISQELMSKSYGGHFKSTKIVVGGKEKKKYNTAANVIHKYIDTGSKDALKVSSKRLYTGTFSKTRGFEVIKTPYDLKDKLHVYNQVDMVKEFASIPLKEITESYAFDVIKDFPCGSEVEADPNPDPIVLNKGLKFKLHQVKCVDETNPERFGDDEIAAGGVAMDDKGIETKVNEFKVRDDFDDGESKNYSPAKILKTFDISSTDYPKTFLFYFALAEKDSGGLSDFIQELYEAVKAEVQAILEALGAAVGAYIGTQIGGSIGTAVAGPIGSIIGAVVGAIIGALIAWLINALKDDIFEPQLATITLPNVNSSFQNGGLSSPNMYLHFYGYGGHYRVKYNWEIIR